MGFVRGLSSEDNKKVNFDYKYMTFSIPIEFGSEIRSKLYYVRHSQ